MRRKFTIFALFYLVFEGKFQVQAPRGAYMWRGDLTEGFLRYDFGRLIFGGAYTWRGFIFGILRYVSHKILGVGSGQKCVKSILWKCSHKEGHCEFWFCRFAHFWDIFWFFNLNSTVFQIVSFVVTTFLALVFFFSAKNNAIILIFGIQCGFQF